MSMLLSLLLPRLLTRLLPPLRPGGTLKFNDVQRGPFGVADVQVWAGSEGTLTRVLRGDPLESPASASRHETTQSSGYTNSGEIRTHVLVAPSQQEPCREEYSEWFAKKGDVVFVPQSRKPRAAPHARVSIFYLTKPVFQSVGQATDVWHGSLGFRVEGGPSYMFEFTGMNYKAATVYPEVHGRKRDEERRLRWPTQTVVDYTVDPSGSIFPVIGHNWTEITPVGQASGEIFNKFVDWAYGYAVKNPRYFTWQVREPGTERCLLDSMQCWNFIWDGLRFLKETGATINATHVKSTVIQLYASDIHLVPFNETVWSFFQNEMMYMRKWLELSRRFPWLDWLIRHRSMEWYWPAWYSPTSYAGGNGTNMQDDDSPPFYYKIDIAWPQKTNPPTIPMGVRFMDWPISPADREATEHHGDQSSHNSMVQFPWKWSAAPKGTAPTSSRAIML